MNLDLNHYIAAAWLAVVLAAVGLTCTLLDAPPAVGLAVYGALVTVAIAVGVSVVLDPQFKTRGAR
ncbi:hypothetical protein [Burkholderia gladioli]|uniref:hypothetical protein n=1 Tax=Burkholderia gladioli TaxID=28095 RepID=UPI001641C387|nr:hypothetical protein [Burkholderia gladioli]